MWLRVSHTRCNMYYRQTSKDVWQWHTMTKNRDWFGENDRHSRLSSREDGGPSSSPCTASLSRKERYFLTRMQHHTAPYSTIQHHTAQTRWNTERLVGRPSVYWALWTVYGPSHQVRTPLHSSDRQHILSDNTSNLAHLSMHFQSLLSAERTVQDTAIHRTPQLPSKLVFD